MTDLSLPPRSALYLPASNPRAIEKAKGLDADMIILDLEDAVKPDKKDEARAAAVLAAQEGFGARRCAIRINGPESEWYTDDSAAVAQSRCDFVVLPKVETAALAATVIAGTGKPLLAMIETPRGVLNASGIAAVEGMVGLIVGTNDLATSLHIPPDSGRASMGVALQTIILAARAAGIWALDGVFNGLEDPAGLLAECTEGQRLGFDGKTLIHPNQIATTNAQWSPSAQEIAEAQALIEAARGGAERYEGRMIETMHVDAARRLLSRR
jgi:(3S)-malyl-CoA thioesterase